MVNDMIVALATPQMKSPISIIRISGKGCIEVVNELFSNDLLKCASHTINYGYIVDKQNKLDEVLISVFKAPKSYTCEDIVEINTHGGIAITRKILNLLLAKGIRLAKAGEFSKRAYLNGRIDLLELEGINDMIDASSEKQAELAIKGLSSQTTDLVNSFKDELVQIIAQIEAKIDYPEYDDIEDISSSALSDKLMVFKDRIKFIISNSKNAQVIKNGIKVAIIGQPNVGKSSLLNAFLERDKAIVTDIAGTTRDVVEAEYALNGINLLFLDTAGIRVSDDVVERIGIEKSYQSIREADLVLLVISSERDCLNELETNIINEYASKCLVVINKSDLANSKITGIKVSALNKEIDDLKKAIIDKLDLDIDVSNEALFLSNERHLGILNSVVTNIDDALGSLDLAMPNDIVVSDLELAYSNLQELLGNTNSDSLLDELFSRFCLGK